MGFIKAIDLTRNTMIRKTLDVLVNNMLGEPFELD
jgi:hypothetical protein